MNKPHKHAELIKAWADGAQIQFRDKPDCQWEDWTKEFSPSWREFVGYRIKPEPKPDIVANVLADITSHTAPAFCWDSGRDSNLKLIFDGETGKLKDAQVLN